MEDLIIEATKATPSLRFLGSANRLEIRGESYPENPAKFYEPVFAWLERYLGGLNRGDVTLDLEITYFNSSSSKVLLDMLDLLEAAAARGNSIVLNWHYHEDNDMAMEYGEEFQDEVQAVTFNLVPFSG